MSVAVVYETHSTSVDNEEGFATGWLGARSPSSVASRRSRSVGAAETTGSTS